jgi:hypothetical protein
MTERAAPMRRPHDGNPSVRLPSALLLATWIVIAVSVVAACGQPEQPPVDVARSVLLASTPDGFRLDRISHDVPPSMAPLMTGRTEPQTLTVGRYQSSGEPTRSITVTLATYPDDVGPLAAYNGWFAENAFMAAVERNALELGDQAECFDVQWPPFHAVIARQGPLFALVEADTSVPLDQCRGLMTSLLAGWQP